MKGPPFLTGVNHDNFVLGGIATHIDYGETTWTLFTPKQLQDSLHRRERKELSAVNNSLDIDQGHSVTAAFCSMIKLRFKREDRRIREWRTGVFGVWVI